MAYRNLRNVVLGRNRVPAGILPRGMQGSNDAPKANEPLFPALSGRLKGMPPDRVAWYQRARLEAAMISSVAQHGYTGTTVAEVVESAAVSKTTFYEHFASKEDCFLKTYDDIYARVSDRVRTAYGREEDPRARLTAGLRTLMDLVVSEPDAARLAVIEVLTVGTSGIRRQEEGQATFEAQLKAGLNDPESGWSATPHVVQAIAAGLRGVVYRNLRAGTLDELPGLVDVLVDWIFTYRSPENEAIARAAKAAEQSRSEAAAGTGKQLDWSEPPDSERSRASLTQRERIVRAVGQLAVRDGFERVTVRAISAASGTSNQTFYEQFDSKTEALIAAFELSASEGLYSVTQAFSSEGDRPEAIGAGIRAMMEHVGGNDLLARLTFFELQSAGPLALDRADAVMDGFIAFVTPGIAPKGVCKEVPQAVLQATSAGVWSIIQHELSGDHPDRLPELGPEVTRIIMAPVVKR
jgi:AcrR family transcriptional regulator